jgi:pSer/pThr/pTyr-binding forkhead associated (FHA) protein
VVALVNASRARVTAVVARLSTKSRGRSLPALLLPSTGRPVVTIGRSLGCDLVLGDSTVSRRHAKLRAFGGQWFLEDLGSTNGTRVNGIRIRAATVVRPGASVGFGRLEFLVDGEPDTGTTG